MRVKKAIRSEQATVLELDTGDPKDQHFHVIPDGVLETRMEAWNLTREDALDLVLAEAHGDQEIPDRFSVDDLVAAKKVVSAVAVSNPVVWQVPRSQVADLTRLDPEMEDAVRKHVRDELGRPPLVVAVGLESVMALRQKSDEVASGYQRRSEEILADDIIKANPDLKRAPRVRPDEPVGLTVKFT